MHEDRIWEKIRDRVEEVKKEEGIHMLIGKGREKISLEIVVDEKGKRYR